MAVSWLNRGAQSAALAKDHEALVEKKKSEIGKMFRFFIKKGEEARITFVDGDLTPEGLLLPPRFYEHNLYQGGKWNNFYVCPEQTCPGQGYKCPICATGDTPYLAAAFTIIDHRSFTTKEGKVYANQRRLFIAKPTTFELLAKLAVKRGGLAGCTFDAMRTGDKDASVGGQFDFQEKHPLDHLKALYQEPVKNDKGDVVGQQTAFRAANYDEEFVFRTPEQLLASGFGGAIGQQPAAPAAPASTENYAEHL